MPSELIEQRHRQLRRRMLVLAKHHKSQYDDGFLPAKNFLTVADDNGIKVVDEDECLSLLGDLVALTLLAEWQPMGMSGKARAFAQRRFKLTDRGYALWSHELDPIPSIADERLGD